MNMAGLTGVKLGFLTTTVVLCLLGHEHRQNQPGSIIEIGCCTSYTVINHHRVGSDLSVSILHSIFSRGSVSIYRFGKPIHNGNHERWLTYLTLQCILRGGDISLYPGPSRCRCIACSKPIGKVQAIQCDFCDLWTHRKCADLSVKQFRQLGNSDECYFCSTCVHRLPQFSDSYFLNDAPDNDVSILSMTSEYSNPGVFEKLIEVRNKHPRKLITGHLNINSLRYKFDEIKPLLISKTVDILFISETKLDSSFRDQLFQVDGYRLERRDRNGFGGGIAAFVRTDIPARRRKELETQQTESIFMR